MHRRTPHLLIAAVIVAAVTALQPASRVVEARAAEPALRGISSRVVGDVTTLRIEATDPVAYVTSRPDPLTVLVELRNVRVPANAGQVGGPMLPIRDVAIERATDWDGMPLARVRIALAEDAPHRVRSARNVIFVEVDRGPAPSVPAIAAANAVPAPAVRPDAASAFAAQASQTSQTSQASPTQTVPAETSPAQTPPAQTLQAPAPPTPAPLGTALGPPPKRFTGHPVTLDFQGADLRAVLRTFAEISGLNIVLDGAIAGTVDVALRDVPWDQALDIILRSNKLGYVVDGTIVRIVPLTALAQEEEERRKLAEAQALAGELHVLTRTLSYAKAQDLVSILTKSALSQRGDVQVDQRTNTLVIRDLQARLSTADELIKALDKPERQVEIEARIIRVRRDYSKELGVLWGMNGRMSPDLGNTTNLQFPNRGSLGGRTGGAQGPDQTSTAVNLGTEKAATGAIGLALGSVNGAFQLDVALQALEDQGKLRLLSSPRVSTQNNIEAEITQGTQIPLQTVANNTVTVSFKDAALTLKVTPQITASDTVILRISLEKSQADFSRQINGIPPIDTQRASTNVLLSNGETTVIGGIFESQEVTKQSSVPFLSRLPLFSWLFKNNIQSELQDELMIFITPRILEI